MEQRVAWQRTMGHSRAAFPGGARPVRPSLILTEALALQRLPRKSLHVEGVFVSFSSGRHKFDLAEEQFKALSTRFPNSMRVRGLEGMKYEAQATSMALMEEQRMQLAEKAMSIYEDIVSSLCPEHRMACQCI
eukprot:607779-Rhodomonas_salina.1